MDYRQQISKVGYVEKGMKQLIISEVDAVNEYKRSDKPDITVWGKRFTRKCMIDPNLTILPNGIETSHNPP